MFFRSRFLQLRRKCDNSPFSATLIAGFVAHFVRFRFLLLLVWFAGWPCVLTAFLEGFSFSPRDPKMAVLAARPPHGSFAHQKTVLLVVDEGMEVDALSIVRSLPDFQAEIVRVIPEFCGKCFDITLWCVESMTQLATIGFDYLNQVKPLRLLRARSMHVSVFVGGISRQGTDFIPQTVRTAENKHSSSPV